SLSINVEALMKSRRSHYFSLSLSFAAFILLAGAVWGQPYNENSFKGMKWRSIGPYRGGRVLAVSGVVGDHYTYYFGGVACGVWRTIDGGGRWRPLFGEGPVSAV